ncbi:glycosyltransferase [Rhizobium sp. BE258]|uniref:glycosyltransferase n=1 Tax=Rhizobium sp. BE258 TaxID=2817722 RepID=UPI0028607AD9|nr:glycosyltransferase [Rhizobium sp. BE258]MDR7145338.1 hypothetical protein [Rhizobium sp. BE258]
MTHVLYLVHDLTDPAVRRRVIALKQGGASVDIVGFARAAVPDDIEGVFPRVIGRTKDGHFVQRCLAVLKARRKLRSILKDLAQPDVIIARNLETLSLTSKVNRLTGEPVPVVFECLDIHRLLLGQGGVGKAMRLLERWCGRHVCAVITSSPAFKTNYFDSLSLLRAPVHLLENKVVQLDDDVQVSALPRSDDRPWRIGWFGALRCRKSFKLLSHFSRMAGGRVEIILRGRPAYREFDDFDAEIAAEPFMRFEGPYRNPEDLSAIYGEVDFAWAVDCFEEGQNSKWLLPNRLYEGCLYGAVPIALDGTQTAATLNSRGIGMTINDVTPFALARIFDGMTYETYRKLASNIAALDKSNWVYGPSQCRELVAWLGSLRPLPGEQRSDAVSTSSSFAI